MTRPVQPIQVTNARPEAFVLDPRRTAVLVIDMQNDFGAPGGMFDAAGIDISGIRAVVPATARVLAAARDAGMPVVYLKMAFRPDLSDAGGPEAPNRIKHAWLRVGETSSAAPDGRPSRVLVRDCWNTDILQELAPAPGDVVLYKHRYSGFYDTALDAELRKRGIDSLVVTGCTTSVCVDATVRDAMYRDYRCLLLEDCTAEPLGAGTARSNHEASLLTLQALFCWIVPSQAFLDALTSPPVRPATLAMASRSA
jgi:ureidoacrylate peracid hydrolase